MPENDSGADVSARGGAHMTLRQVEVFCAVAKHESMKLAAREMGISLPTISGMMSQLQSSLGVDLIAVAHRESPLTPAGRKFYAAIGPAMKKVKRTIKQVKENGL
jgi:DNA-binding transcriptional LysR family regulator